MTCPACGSPYRNERWKRNHSRNGGRWCSDAWHSDEYLPLNAVRRLGSKVTHFASYGDELRADVRVNGAQAVLVDAPLVAMCGAILRGDVVEMRRWQTQCQPCKAATKRAAVREPLSHSGSQIAERGS